MSAARRVRTARSLRLHQTDAEQKLWRHLRNRAVNGLKFRRQVPLGPYVVDFVCFECKLIIEADGGQHADSSRDRVRDTYFKARGYKVLRFWNTDTLNNFDAVLALIDQAIKEQHRDH